MKILIRGAGDLATGIASRLYRTGHKIIMTETQIPLTVRRMAALSRAVYEKEAVLEDLRGVLVSGIDEAERVLADGDIPVIVDPQGEIRHKFCPDVLVDAIIAKKNLGTRITDAPFVIGTGPGFTAGVDCHCVIETKRGHTLGDTIYEGEAIENTGVPGVIGGFSTERLIRAAADGLMEPVAKIGDTVEKGQLVAVTGGREVYAKMSGVVRGMLQGGVNVTEGLKIGDIDARSERFHCFTISDKARAVGGAALEAVERFSRTKGRYAFVALAAGEGLRFGENKLLAEVDGAPMYLAALKKLEAFSAFPRFIVTGCDRIARDAKLLGIEAVANDKPKLGISRSVKLGLEACCRQYPDIQGILFLVCDQPSLKTSTLQRILNGASVHTGQIICAGAPGHPGNPVLFDRAFFDGLRGLEGDCGGRAVLQRFPERVRYVPASCGELKDIDYKSDIM